MNKKTKERVYNKMIRSISTRWINSFEKYKSLNEPHDEYFYERKKKPKSNEALPF